MDAKCAFCGRRFKKSAVYPTGGPQYHFRELFWPVGYYVLVHGGCKGEGVQHPIQPAALAQGTPE